MSTNYHWGDNITQYGDYSNVTLNKNQGSADAQAVLRELVSLVVALRAQVGPADQQAIDESVAVVRQGDRAERGALGRGLGRLIGIATMAGTAGAPVLDAALKVKDLFGL